MSRNLLFVLLLATGVAVADKKPEAKHATSATAAQKKTAAVRGQTEEAQTKSKAAQVNTEEAQAETEEHRRRMKRQRHKARVKRPQQAQTDKDGKLISVPGGKALGMSVLAIRRRPRRWSSFPGRARKSAARQASRRCSTIPGSL